jgi:cell division protein FtsW
VLLLLGLVMVLSSSTIASLQAGHSPYTMFVDQAKFALIGVPLLLVAARLPVTVYRAMAWPALGGAVALQMLTFTGLAHAKNGNTNWITIPGINQSVQPSEFIKLALVIWLAAVLSAKGPLLREWQHVLVPAVIVAAGVVGLVLVGRDLGTVLILVALVAGALYVAGIPMWMFSIAGGVVAAGVAVLALESQNRMSRIAALFSSGTCDVSDECFQTQHGLWALGSGGVGGVGLGASREKWLYLPEAHNDYIFAIIGEELGLLGTLLVLVLFAALAIGLLRVIKRHPDPFVKIATGAVAAWILSQAIINIGVVIGVFPVIGVPLPLLSAGGSALITTLAALGIVLAFARTEPGASEGLHARRGALRRTLAVLPRRVSRG